MKCLVVLLITWGLAMPSPFEIGTKSPYEVRSVSFQVFLYLSCTLKQNEGLYSWNVFFFILFQQGPNNSPTEMAVIGENVFLWNRYNCIHLVGTIFCNELFNLDSCALMLTCFQAIYTMLLAKFKYMNRTFKQHFDVPRLTISFFRNQLLRQFSGF